MKLTILKYAESVIGENFVFSGGKKGRIWPISFFLFLFEEENRKILVDTGCNVLPGFPLSRFIKPLDLLLKYGEYSGVGIKSSIGMGAIRVQNIERKKRQWTKEE